MTAQILSGNKIARDLSHKNLIPRVENLISKGIMPKLVVILIGENPASKSYISQKEKFAKKIGIQSEVLHFEAETSQDQILQKIEQLNQDKTVHGIIVQLPTPDHVSIDQILSTIDPSKDVDGFTPENIGNLFLGQPCLPCCTPKGTIHLIDSTGINLEGKKVTVIGRSNIVGKPVSILALEKNATVKICHSRTKNLSKEIKESDVLIVAVGKPEFLHGDQIPKGCVVIDVGIHRKADGKLCGDVHFESAKEFASFLTPVPGGVGPMTVYSLIENTIQSAESSNHKI